MAGRTLSVPAVVRKTFSTSPMGTTLSYTFDPDLLLGWNYPLGEAESSYIPERYRRLPLLGGWFGKTAGVNIELLATHRPDLLISVTTSSDRFAEDNAELLANKTGVPVAMLALRKPEDIPQLYTALGELTGNTQRARQLSRYADQVVSRARRIAGQIPPAQRIRVYYAEGLEGLNTEPEGSIHAQLIEFCGGQNVARMPNTSITAYGNAPVSLEQVVAWNPELILISDYLGREGGRNGWRNIIDQNPLWRKVRAVQENRVFVIPRSPFQWIDRPPSVNRLAGLIWLPALFYPAHSNYDVKVELMKLFALFYHTTLSPNQVTQLPETSIRF